MRFAELVETSDGVARTSARLEKIDRLAALLKRAAAAGGDVVEIAVAFLSGAPRQGRIGLGGAALSAVRHVAPATGATLDLAEVDETFAEIRSAIGPGSAQAKGDILGRLLARSTSAEQNFSCACSSGELRQGALEGVLIDAVARAAGIAAARVRRATMLAGDARRRSRARRSARASDGARRVRSCVRFNRSSRCSPIRRPTSPTRWRISARPSFEYKLDGARIQVHKVDDDVRVFSRNLRDVTIAVPEVVAARARDARTRG